MKTSAIALCRVSTPEQTLNNSLNRQQESVLKTAQGLGVDVIKWWSGDVSSKAGTNVKRKDLQEMLAFCKQNKRVKFLIVDEPDRFMRSIDEAFYFEVMFRELGVTVWYASDPNLNNGDLMAKMLKFSKLLPAEGSNIERQTKSISGHEKAIREGRYTFPPKPGYMKGETPGVHIRHPITYLPLQRALKEVAEGVYTPLEAMKRLKATEFGKHYERWDMDKFRRFGTDPYYAGILELNKQVKCRNENGLHEAMITRQEHERLKEVFLGRYKPRGEMKQYNPEFPMNKLLSCEDCGSKLTGSRKSNGFTRENGQQRKTTHYYWKYRCRGCGKEYHRFDVHQNITEHFGNFEYAGRQDNAFIGALETVWKQKQADKLNTVKRLQNSLQKLNTTKSSLVLELGSTPDEFKEDIRAELTKLKHQIKNTEQTIAESQDLQEDLVDFVDFALNYGEELKQDWWDLGPEDRQRCQQLLFPGGITINSDKKVSTHNMSPIYRLAANKKDLRNTRKSLMVELAGTAPASISLSLLAVYRYSPFRCLSATPINRQNNVASRFNVLLPYVNQAESRQSDKWRLATLSDVE